MFNVIEWERGEEPDSLLISSNYAFKQVCIYVGWADKRRLHAAKNINFSMHNHCYQVFKVKIRFNSFLRQYHELSKNV